MKENSKARVQNFYKRWNIEYGQEKRVEDFKNRVLSTIDTIITQVFMKSENSPLFLKYLRLIGIYISGDHLDHMSRNWKERILGSKIESANLEETIFYLQQLFWLNIAPDVKNRLYESFKEDIELSLLDISLKKTKHGEYLFYPSGAKLLDEGVVNDVLDWLSDYPESCKSFESALKKYQEHKYERNLIDDLRLSLELLLKRILKNKKSLDNQKETLGKYLKEKSTPTEIREMFTRLATCYVDYQNEYAKHNDKVREAEVEFMIYLTGTFMRFLLSLEKNSKKET